MDMDAVPFTKLEANVHRKPKPQYPAELKSIGDHIRKRRLDLELEQKDVARMWGILEETVSVWERKSGEPDISLYPKIIEFLGYFPFEIDTSTIAGKIREYRYKHGLSKKHFGILVGADGPSVVRWESGKRQPNKTAVHKINLLWQASNK